MQKVIKFEFVGTKDYLGQVVYDCMNPGNKMHILSILNLVLELTDKLQ